MSSGSDPLSHIHGSSLEVIPHAVEELFRRDFIRRLYPQRHSVRGIVTERIIEVSVHVGCNASEKAPHTRFAGPHGAEIERRIGIGEAEIFIRPVEITLFPGKGDHVGGIEAILRIVQRELGDAGLIGMSRHISVGNAAGDPDDSFADVLSLPYFASLADQLHDPGLLGICDRERFAAGVVAVLVGQIDDDANRLACGASPLQRDIDQRSVVHHARRVGQLAASAKRTFGNDELVFVHVAHRGVGLFRLRDHPQPATRIPFVDGKHGPRFIGPARGTVLIEGSVELVRIGCIGHHYAAIGRGSARNDEIGAGIALSGEKQRGEKQRSRS